MIRDGYLARRRGREYEASPDGDQVRLYRPDAAEGFEQVRPGRFRQVVPVDEVEDIVYVRTACRWRGAPFIILAEHDSWLRVEEFDFGVYQSFVPRDEITEIQEYPVSSLAQRSTSPATRSGTSWCGKW